MISLNIFILIYFILNILYFIYFNKLFHLNFDDLFNIFIASYKTIQNLENIKNYGLYNFLADFLNAIRVLFVTGRNLSLKNIPHFLINFTQNPIVFPEGFKICVKVLIVFFN